MASAEISIRDDLERRSWVIWNRHVLFGSSAHPVSPIAQLRNKITDERGALHIPESQNMRVQLYPDSLAFHSTTLAALSAATLSPYLIE